jgi:acetoin utilization protein AcuB
LERKPLAIVFRRKAAMLVKNWMTHSVVTVDETTSMAKASLLMKEKRIRSLPVVDSRHKVVGIVTDRDIQEASPSKATSLSIFELNYLISKLDVKSIMTKTVAFVRPDEMLEFAAALMAENKISSLPVLDERDKLVGIVTKTDIFKAFIHITGFYAGGIQFGLRLEDRPGSIKEVADIIRHHGGRVISILSTREMAEKGQRDVYIRTAGVEGAGLRDLTEELQKSFEVLYVCRHYVDELEKRRIRIPD